MAYEIYQSRFTGAKIDESLGMVATLTEDVAALKKDYPAEKIKMADGTTTLPDYLNETDFTIALNKDENNILEKTETGYKVAKPDSYELPTASTEVLGGVKVDGTTINIDENGIISGVSTYTLPIATTTELGGVKVDGTTITVDSDGTIHGASAIDNLDDIGDVTLSDIQNGQALIWNGSNWINGNVASGDDESSIIEKDLYYSYGKYSKNEICIGEYLGKPLYRKIYTNIQIPKATQSGTVVHTSFDSGVLVDALISINCKWYLSSGNYTFGNEYQAPSANNGAYYDFSSNKIFLANSNTNWNNAIGTIIIEYTKKSDSENSFNPSMVTNNVRIAAAPYYEDYSDEEICIGKWTDGKPIYRKVFNVTYAETISDQSWAVNFISNVGNIKPIKIYIIRSDNNGTIGSVWCRVVNNNLDIWNTSQIGNVALYNSKVILEYTKKSDAENSFTPNMISNDILVDTVKESDVSYIINKLGGGE